MPNGIPAGIQYAAVKITAQLLGRQTETPLLPNPHEYVLHDILCKFLRDETAGEYDQAGRIFVIDAIETAEVPLFWNERESFIRRIRLYFIRM